MNESVVPVSVLSGLILLLLSSKRFRSRMAAVIAWLVGSITGSRGEKKPSEENKQAAETSKGKPKTDIKQNKGKIRHRAKKVNEEPTFNTKLSTPIEDIIEETLSEEKTETQSSSSQATSEALPAEKSKAKKKKKAVKKEKSQSKSDEEENVGFSFFKPKPVQPSQRGNKQSLEKPVESKVSEINSVDNVGYSFFPIKERSRKGKGKLAEKQNSEEALTTVIAQGITKRSETSRPSIIDHYKTQDLPVTKRVDTTHNTENLQSFVLVNKVETYLPRTDLKESKKVTSHISYASVVNNCVPENLISEEEDSQKVNTNETVGIQEKLSKEVSSSIEVLSQCSEDLDINTELAQEVSETTVLVSNEIHELSRIENFTSVNESNFQINSEISNSTSDKTLECSIEVIENTEVDKQKTKESNSQFGESVINSVNNSEHSFSYNYVENHFENIQSKEVEYIDKVQEVKENIVTSQDNLIETITEELNDQALNDFVEQLVHDKDPNIVDDNVQENIKNFEAFLIEESRDYLEENFYSEEKDVSFTEPSDKLKNYSLNNTESLQPNQLTEDQLAEDQHSSELETKEGVVNTNTKSKPLNNEKSVPDFQDSYIRESEKLDNIEKTAAKEELQEELYSSENKLISELVEDFINAEIQQELTSKSNLDIQQVVPEIVAVEQTYSQQESELKPVEEEPFIKKVAYTTTGNQNKNTTNKIVQDLAQRTNEEPFNIDKIIVRAPNSEGNQVADTQLIQTIEQNQDFSTNIKDLNQQTSEETFITDKIIVRVPNAEENQIADTKCIQAIQPNQDITTNKIVLDLDQQTSEELFNINKIIVSVPNTEENQDITNNITVKDLDQQTREETFNIDKIVVSASNTGESQIAETQFIQTIDQDQTEIHNQKFSEGLVDNIQILNNLVIEELTFSVANTEDNPIERRQIQEHTVNAQIVQNNYETQELQEVNIEASQDYISKQELSVESYQANNNQDKQGTKYYSREELLFTNMTQIRVLTLNNKEHHESTIFRIEKNFTLQFRLGPSLLGRKIRLYCNYPKEANGVLKEFDRDTYQLLSWCQDEGCKNADDTALFTQIVAKISGSFHFYFIYENADTEERQGSGYFLVDPVLKYGNEEELPLDCIQCQTVLAKQLGPFSTWENKLKVAKESGYNVVHFTPIQELGASKSCYSLSDQLKLNPMFNEENGKKSAFEDVEKLTIKMRKEWKVLSVCDIVLNHTANESEWIKEHPEATYNCVNCPYMRPAYLLDAALYQFSMDVKKGYYEDRGVPAEISTEEHLTAIRYHFKASVLDLLKLQELFMVDVNKYLEDFLTLARKTPPIGDNERDSLREITIIQDPEFRRLKSTIDLDLAIKVFNIYRLDCFDEESRVKRCAEDMKNKLDSLNEVVIKEVTDDLNTAVDNVVAGIKYFRVQADGPKFKDISTSQPLVYRYFTDYGSPKSLKEHEEIMYSANGRFLMAHNGWIMNSDPLKNFAASGTKIYIRRELVAWGDSVKLRYGDKPEDSPFLWDYMRKYVELTAKIFDGVRLDNCHSTPIPVAEYLLDAARKIRPDLYVVAELFTNSDLTDNIFVNRLGITSLIREAMSAWDSHEEGRLVYRYGGVPVGSFFQPNVRPLVPMVAHALFLDLTHDNPSPVEKRSVFDLLPSTALVNMACCASGSNRGYDELVPHHIHVVDETRQYTEWSEDESLAVGNVKFVNNRFGIIAAKRALNELHFKLGKEGYNQVYVDQMDPDIVAVTRHNPETHTSYVLVAFTAFNYPDIHAGNYQRGIKPLRVEGVLDEIVLEASLNHIDAKSGGSRFTKSEAFTKDSTFINGLSEYQVSLKQHIQVNQSDILEEVNSGTDNVFQLNFKNFKPGSIAVVRVSLPQDTQESVSKVRSLIGSFSAKKDTELKQIISRMSLSDLNRALYRCDQEERDEGNGFDAYNIPNFGSLVYCGLQGFMSLLANIRPNNDLGHPFCANLREGNWLIEYIWKRLKVDDGTKELGQWIEENTKYLHDIPRYLIPCYFDVIVTGLYVNLLEQCYSLMSDFVKCGSTFVRGLSLGSLQFAGYVRSANLPTLSPNLALPKPPTRENKSGETVQACVTLSAGLPHFAVGYMRNWGRDTFIALRGLFILTGRFEEARQHILGYGACLRHGLIPNLLDGGRNSRFNCRDAIWWWLYCIKSYCEEASNGAAILSDKVSRIFPTDDSAPQPPGAVDQPLHDVIQESLKVHFQGLKFRERNAGRQIDEQMTDSGFNNQIGIHPETGFVFGGNQWNCGTWMDKMGSSDKAGNKGKPATPRDGSAVELVGLSKAVVSWLWKLNQEGKYPYNGVERTHKNGAVTKWTFKEWSDKIQENFETKFWIGSKPSSDETRPDLVNKKNIYKDSLGASQTWTDFQLRPNFPIAMVAAPEMFDPQHAWAALEQVEKYLLGPLGMKTLDPEDWNYRGDYDNSNDSNDFNLSHGFNYHQGPEWVWPLGFFLRAKLIFAAQNGVLKETLASTKVILSKHFTELQTSAWRGLPELTNSNGSYCKDSSRTQAWSMSCVLEVLHDLQQIESKQIIVN